MLLKLNTVSEDVVKWQTILKAQGYNIGAVDGIFGAKVKAATIAWQKANGLTADGIVGDKSWQKAGLAPVPSTPGIISSSYYPPKPDFKYPNVARVKELFGNFRYRNKKGVIEILDSWADKNIVNVHIAALEGVFGAPTNGIIQFHKLGVTALQGAFNEIQEKGLVSRIISFGGSFYPRFIRGSTTQLSNHSWGSALDLNAPENWLGKQPAKIGQKGCLLELVPIFNKWGFFWGGHYQNRLDGMHFELAKLN